MVGQDCAEKGLSLMVQQILGRPLDKTEQMSNWEKRPLRISQIRYAGRGLYMHRLTLREMLAYCSLFFSKMKEMIFLSLTNCKPINASPLSHAFSHFLTFI